MSRYIHQGWFFDGNGKLVGGGTVAVFLAGSTTVASIYAASSGGVAVNSVTSSTTDGSWYFYVDQDDYSHTQHFKIILSKSGFTSKTIDNVVILPDAPNLINEDTLYIYKTIDASTDFGTDLHAWGLKVVTDFDIAAEDLTSSYTGGSIEMAMVNDVNDTDVELAMCYGYTYALTVNSKAAMYGYGVDLIKQTPCVTAATLVGFSALLVSDVVPTSIYQGVGFLAQSADLGAYTGSKQWAGFQACGTQGWTYPFLAYGTDNTTALFLVDENGKGYFASTLAIAGVDPGSGTASQLTLCTDVTPYVDGSGESPPLSTTGAGTPTFNGWLKIWNGTSAAYIPIYSSTA